MRSGRSRPDADADVGPQPSSSSVSFTSSAAERGDAAARDDPPAAAASPTSPRWRLGHAGGPEVPRGLHRRAPAPAAAAAEKDVRRALALLFFVAPPRRRLPVLLPLAGALPARVRRLLRPERQLGAEPELRDERGGVPSDKGPVKKKMRC